MVDISEVKGGFLEVLIRKGAIRIAPSKNELFVFKSGRRSPNFINIGALTDGESLNKLKLSLAHFIADLLKKGELEDFDFIFGPAYKGISLATLACEGLKELYGLNKRYLYDRKEEKSYADKAMDKIIVGAGYFRHGDRVLIIDDVVTTGETKLDAVKKLELLGSPKLVGLVLVVDRQEKAGDAEIVEEKSTLDYIREELKLKVFSLVNMEDVFKTVSKDLSKEIRESWKEYYEKYGNIKLE